MSTLPATLSYEEWTQRLADRFFRAEFAMNHVMFFVDGDCLADISGLDETQAVESLANAVAGKLHRQKPRQLLLHVVRATDQWKRAGAVGPPPALPTLALAVLAATRMRRTTDVAGNNYYEWLLALLRDAGVPADKDDLIESYRLGIKPLWDALQWWLDEHHEGQLGLSTITGHSLWRYVGLADSQTLFSSSDTDKLTMFFAWIGLKPGESVDEHELVQLFRLWAARQHDIKLNLGTLTQLEEDEHPAQLASILAASAARWEGVVRDEEGRKQATLVVTLDARPPWKLGLAAPRVPGFPPQLEIALPGRKLSLHTEDSGYLDDEIQWYEGLDLEFSGRFLEQGLQLSSDDYVLRLPPFHYQVLHKSRELGLWASEQQLRPSEPAWLLVRDRVLDEVSGFLGEYAREGWTEVKTEGIAPPGWHLIRDVIVDHPPVAVDGVLSRLCPRTSNRAALSGGLPLPAGTGVYLERGEPDLVLPPWDPDAPPVTFSVDERELPVDRGAAGVRLADLDLPPGSHEVRFQGAKRTFSTLWSRGSVRPRVERPVGQVFELINDLGVPRTPGAHVDAEVKDGELLLEGALLTGTQGAQAPMPLILPVVPEGHVLLGARPGEISSVNSPTKPGWMVRAGLEFRVFEHDPKFPVVWQIRRSSLSGDRAVLVNYLDPVPVEAPEGVRIASWRLALEGCTTPANETAAELWTRYLEIAAGLADA